MSDLKDKIAAGPAEARAGTKRGMSRRRFLGLCALGGAVPCAIGVYSVFVERYIVQTNRYRIRLPGLPAAFEGFRIVHLTDIHFGPLVSLESVREIVGRANALDADIIVCTGDFVHRRNTRDEIDAVWPELSKLKAKQGVYSVLGNHDHWADTERSMYWMNASGQGIRHRSVPLVRSSQRIWLVGAGDFWEDHIGIDVLMNDVPPDECRIVLAHNPDSADTGIKGRVDLMLAGHTHGGQVSIPFFGSPVLPVRNRNYSQGLVKSRAGFPLFISRGIGWAILPVRCNCFPEIAVLELFSE